jgi:hypothetical protein
MKSQCSLEKIRLGKIRRPTKRLKSSRWLRHAQKVREGS